MNIMTMLLALVMCCTSEVAAGSNNNNRVLSSQSVLHQDPKGLFLNDPYVTELSSEALNDFEQGGGVGDESKKNDGLLLSPDEVRGAGVGAAVVVAFYSASCGHCISFAPTWTALARKLAPSGSRLLRIAAVNCDVSVDLCEQFEIRSVPQILAFNSARDIKSANKSNKHNIAGTINEGSIADMITSIQKHFPELTIDRDLEDVDRPSGRGKSGSRGSSWFGGGDSVFGWNKAWNKYNKRTTGNGVGTIVQSPQTFAPLPAETQIVPSSQDLVADAVTAVRFGFETGVFLGRSKLTADEYTALIGWLSLLSRSFPGELHRLQLRHLLMKVAELGVLGLGHVQWESLLDNWEFGEVGDIISDTTVNNGGGMFRTGGKRTNRRPYLNRRSKEWTWRHCGGEVEGVHHGGYSCGLWLVFQTLVASSCANQNESPKQNNNNNNNLNLEVSASVMILDTQAGHGRRVPASPEETAVAIYGFIENFFSCEVCRVNFLKSNPDPRLITRITTIGSDTNNLKQKQDEQQQQARRLVLWLWREHNAVSKRLNSERLADEVRARSSPNSEEQLALLAPYRMREPFPSRKVCPRCHRLRVRLRGANQDTNNKNHKNKNMNKELFDNHDNFVQGPNVSFRADMAMWDINELFLFLLQTFCVPDSELLCPDSDSLRAKWVVSGVSGELASLNGLSSINGAGVVVMRTVGACVVLMLGVWLTVSSKSLRRGCRWWTGSRSDFGKGNPIRRLSRSFPNGSSTGKRDC